MDLNHKLKFYRLSLSEYEQIKVNLGREPQGVEWALFSALWSEHCSYKSSKIHLKKLFNKSPRVVMSFGENAGVVDLGEGEKVAFKMESHNHPSFIEPFQGAATGVGGILRDIFTMGARPVALANYLCFGEPQAARMAALVDGVVRGIGGYGNCVGVPTITGQTEFHKSYNKNILVNALAVGLFLPGESAVSSQAKGVGNFVVYVGAKTGKDGVHGASMASEAFDDKSEAKKPTVQIGDPFFEKLLIESCIEVIKAGLVVAIQDMGAAGLTSSSFEMAAKGGVGFHIHLDKVPLRDSTMTPEEILLSESQERMLLVVEPSQFSKLKQIFSKWDLDAEVIGEVTKNENVVLFWHGEQICEMNPRLLVDQAPVYERPYKNWEPTNRQEDWVPLEQNQKDLNQALRAILSDMRGTSRRWVFDQYDQRVGAKTAMDCSESVGVLRLPSGRGLGLVLGCRPYIMRFDAQVGGLDSIAYPVLELAAKGFLPIAVTDCLNFGNPENPQIMSEFVAAVESMSKMCEGLGAPIISGNVSFYNETMSENITSTPATGLVGLRESIANMPTSFFKQKNDEIFLLRMKGLKMQGAYSEFLNSQNVGSGRVTAELITELTDLVRHLAMLNGVHSTRVVGKFGIVYALARMCTNTLGIEIRGLKNGDYFTENLYDILFAVSEDGAFEFKNLFKQLSNQDQFELMSIGDVRENKFKIDDQIELDLSEISSLYNGSWEATLASIS